jgi:hypothetical protein
MGGGDNSARYQVLENVYEIDGVVDAFSINRITLTRTHHIFNPAGGETLPSTRSGCEFEDFALRWLSLHILHPDSHFLIQASVVSFRVVSKRDGTCAAWKYCKCFGCYDIEHK